MGASPREHQDILEEVEELREDSQALEILDTPERNFFRELQDKSVRKQLFIGVGLMITQNIVGLNALNYCELSLRIWLFSLRHLLTQLYLDAPTIFVSAGFTSVSSSLFLTGFFGIVKVLSATSFMFVFVRLRGNRISLQFGSVCGISMLVLAYYVRRVPAPGKHNPEVG